MPGRKRREIDWEQFDKLCYLQCTQAEIAAWFDCSVDTLARRIEAEYGVKFAEYFEQKRAGGRISLRRKQMQVAESGNVSMLIWLGKNYLGQSDKSEIATRDVKDKLIIQLESDNAKEEK
jgi:hypothetical protein